MAGAYAVTNVFASLGASFYKYPTPTLATNGSYARDARMDKLMTAASVPNSGGILIDCGAAQALVGIALLNHNIVTTGGGAPTITIYADSVNTFATAVTAKASSTLNTTEPNHKDHVFLFPSVSKRYWLLFFGGMSVDPITFSAGEIFGLASITALSRAAVYGSVESEEVLTATNQMQYGETRGVFYGGPVREKRLHFADHSASERTEMRAMWAATKGPVNPFLWVESYNSTASGATAAEQECIYGNLLRPRLDVAQDDYGVFQPGEFIIRSRGREAGA